MYARGIEENRLNEYMMTEGHLWSDRVSIRAIDIQRSRLGGVARRKKSFIYSGVVVSWNFVEPSKWSDLAILVPRSVPDEFKVVAYNLSDKTVEADMTGWDVEPGIWEMVQGIDISDNDEIDIGKSTTEISFGRTESIRIAFPPKAQTVLKFRLKIPGTPYWERPDLGIGEYDIRVEGKEVHVTVHSIGAIDSPETELVLIDRSGNTFARAVIPPLEAPLDLFPHMTVVRLPLPASGLSGCTISIDPEGMLEEITKMNNRVLIR